MEAVFIVFSSCFGCWKSGGLRLKGRKPHHEVVFDISRLLRPVGTKILWDARFNGKEAGFAKRSQCVRIDAGSEIKANHV
jgi:hypothetical protein